jgi:predicted dehydrogenase
MNQAIHNVDLLYWFMGEVAEVCGLTDTLAHQRIEVEDTGAACVRFKSGAIGVLEAATSAFPGLLKRTEIHGTGGSAIVEQDNIKLWSFAKEQKRDEEVRSKYSSKAGTGGAADPKAIDFTGHMLQFKDFMSAVAKGQKPKVDGYEGRKSVEIILAIYKSSWTGRRVELPLKSDPKIPSPG